MEEKVCIPSLATYIVVIGGLCWVGNVDETFSLKKLVVGKGFVPFVLTYGILIDGFCKHKRCSETKLVLEMYNKGLEAGHIVYTALIGGFARQGGEAFWV